MDEARFVLCSVAVFARGDAGVYISLQDPEHTETLQADKAFHARIRHSVPAATLACLYSSLQVPVNGTVGMDKACLKASKPLNGTETATSNSPVSKSIFYFSLVTN